MVNTTVERPLVISGVQLASHRIFFLVAFLILVAGANAGAADLKSTEGVFASESKLGANADTAFWKLVPTIDLSETYSDNVRLFSAGKEESATITQISPGLTITANGQRLKLNLNYVMQNSYYSGVTNESKTNHLLHANTNLAFVQNLLFVDGIASRVQRNLTPFGQVTENNLNLTDNRVEVRTYGISPYLRKNFNNNFTGELRYSYDSVTSDAKSSVNTNSNADTVHFTLKNGTAFKTINWGLSYDRQETHFEKNASLETDMTTLNFDYYLSRSFRLTSTAGHEKNSHVSLGGKPPGYFSTIGFAWVPNQRTSFIFNAGERFYGKTYALTFNQRARMSVWSLGYNENVTTTRGQFLLPATDDTSAFLNRLWETTIPDATSRQQTVDNFIRDSSLPVSLSQPVNTFTSQVFLQKNLQGSIGLTGVKNTIVLNMFNTLRDPLSTGGLDVILNPSLLRKVRQTGVNALWNWQFSPRTNASLNAAYSKAETLDTSLVVNTKTIRASISRQLQKKMKASLEVRHLQHDSTLVTGNYKENAVTLYFLLGF